MSKFYIIHPNGREKLRATELIPAMVEFRNHWTASCNWKKGKKPLVRRLIEETQIEILTDEMEGA